MKIPAALIWILVFSSAVAPVALTTGAAHAGADSRIVFYVA